MIKMDDRPLVTLNTDYDKETIEQLLIPGPRLDEKGNLDNLQIFYDDDPNIIYVVRIKWDKYTPILIYDLKSHEVLSFCY